MTDHDQDGHDWHLFDQINNLECRILPGDIVQLKNDTHFVTLARDELNVFLEDPEFQYLCAEKFNKWDRTYPLGTENNGI